MREKETWNEVMTKGRLKQKSREQKRKKKKKTRPERGRLKPKQAI